MLENISEETLIGLRINKEIIDKSKKNIVNWIIADMNMKKSLYIVRDDGNDIVFLV